MKPGQKLVIDVEQNRLEVSDLTADEAYAVRADRAARVAALQQRWETARDREALLGALIFCQRQLPEWLFKGLMETFEELTRNPDATRFLAVRHAHDVLGMTMDGGLRLGQRKRHRPRRAWRPRHDDEVLPKDKGESGDD